MHINRPVGLLTLNFDIAVNCFNRVSITEDMGLFGRFAMFKILRHQGNV